MKNNIIMAVVGTAIIVGGVAFYGGMKYGQSTNTQSVAQSGRFGQGGNGGNRAGGAGRFAGGGIVSGIILSKDANSITVQLRGATTTEGSGSKIVLLSSSTQVMKAAQGSADDLTVGQQITAMGTANSDGSVTAQSVQVRPQTPSGGQGAGAPLQATNNGA